ncbi:MAG: hypothetical protein KatS3mg111_0901 [Pirellulaceae bacterium]|nr:MAG: hypothetical protein KatS3mg111_0901 [Pirellulaceae bacterium]
MTLNVGKEVAALERMTVSELRERYVELFNETTRARNRTWLIRRIIWRMQSLEQGGLSERAIRQANELANNTDLRVTAPRESKLSPDAGERAKTVACRIEGNSRVPLPGTVITRRYKGRLIQVKVVRDGFEFEGELFKSLSAVAKQVTGSHWNGYKFFNLNKEGESR